LSSTGQSVTPGARCCGLGLPWAGTLSQIKAVDAQPC